MAIRKIIPLYLSPSRPPRLFRLLICISSHSSAGPNLALSGGGEGTRSVMAGGEGGEEQGWGSQGWGTLGAGQMMAPTPPALPMQEGFHGNVPVLLAPSLELCLPFPPSPSPLSPPQPSCFSSLLPWRSHNPQRISVLCPPSLPTRPHWFGFFLVLKVCFSV